MQLILMGLGLLLGLAVPGPAPEVSSDHRSQDTYRTVERRLGAMRGAIALPPAASKDGCHIAYVIAEDRRHRVAQDGSPGAWCVGVVANAIVFNPKGRRLACVAYG